jgi:DNA polymerase III subunit gamma/tau
VVVRLLELLGEAMEGIRAGADPRTRLELALVKAAKPEVDASTRALLARIERLEQGGRAPAPQTPAEPAPAPAPATAPDPPAPTRPPPDLGASVKRAYAGDAERARTPEKAETANAPAETPEVVREIPPAAPVAATDLASLVDLWPAVVALVSAGHALCGAVITEARPMEVAGEDLTVGFPTTAAFLKRQAEDRDNRAIVTEALRELTGERWRVSYELREELDDERESGDEGGSYSEEEWVARFKSELDAEEIPIESESVAAQSARKGE